VNCDGPVAGVPRVPITIRGDRRQEDVETDDQGHFTLVGLEPGIYEIEPRLPKPYEPLFDRPVSVKLDGCLAEAYIVVASVPLSGEARNADGSVANERVMLRVARLDAANNSRPAAGPLRDRREYIRRTIFRHAILTMWFQQRRACPMPRRWK